MSTKYTVTIDEFAESHYIKRLRKKKYKGNFDVSWGAFLLMLQKFELFLEKKRMKIVSGLESDIAICKTEFKILPTESAKSSGNRCVVAWHKIEQEIKILFVYDKSDIKGAHETVWWKKKIRENYSLYRDLI